MKVKVPCDKLPIRASLIAAMIIDIIELNIPVYSVQQIPEQYVQWIPEQSVQLF